MKLKMLLKTVAATVDTRVQAWGSPTRLSLVINSLSLMCSLVFASLIFRAALAKEIEFFGAAFLIGIFLLSAGAALAIGYKAETDPPLPGYFLTFKGAVALLASVFVGFGTMASTLTFFEPRTSTTRDTDRISNQVADVGAKVNALDKRIQQRFPDDPPILAGIAGRWGEPDGCALVWNIAVVRRGEAVALEADMVVRPKGQPSFRLLADIVKAEGDRLEVVGVEPASARGRAATFVLNPAIGTLMWDDRSSEGGVEEYVRCPTE